MQTARLSILALVTVLLVVPLAAAAEHHEEELRPVIWVSFLQSQYGKTFQLANLVADNGAKIYDGLMADGHILAWGVGMPINHWPGDDWNVMEWVSFRDWAAMDAFMQAFFAMQGAKSAEQLQAEQQEWLSLVEPRSHHDLIFRDVALEVTPGAAPPRYLALGFQSPNPGQGGAAIELFKEHIQPVASKALADGIVSGYGLSVPEVHKGPGELVFWFTIPSLASYEAMGEAIDEAAKTWGEEAWAKMAETFDRSAHHDRIVTIIHNGGTPRGGDGDGDE